MNSKNVLVCQGIEPSAFSYQLSALGSRLSAVGFQQLAISVMSEQEIDLYSRFKPDGRNRRGGWQLKTDD
jgi:hypothetical protein